MKTFQKASSKSALYLQIINLTLFGKLEILDHFSKLKIMFNNTAALFTKIIIRVVKTMSVNPRKMLF